MIGLISELPRTFVRHLRAFRRYTAHHMLVLTVLNIVMSWAEGLGLALFFPLLGASNQTDALSTSFSKVLHYLHISPTPAAVLPLIVIVFVVKGALSLATLSYQGYLAARIPLQLRREIVTSLRRSDYRTIVGTNAGFVSNLLVNEVNKVDYGFTGFVRTFAPVFNIAVFSAIVLWLDWSLTLVCGVMGFCAIAIIGITGRIAQRASRVLARENALLSGLLIQLVQSFKYLRATAGLGVFQSKIGASAERSARAEFHNNTAMALSQSVAQPLMIVFLAAILYYQAVVHDRPLGSLFVLLLYFVRIMNELWALQSNWQSFIGYLGSIEMVYDAADSYGGSVEHNGTQKFDGLKERISLRALSFHYTPEREVLHDVNLAIARNSTVAFVGESGSGKSTLVDVILGTLKPDSGEVSYDGISLDKLDLDTLRPRVGYVAQDSTLFDDTIANNIAMWADVTQSEIAAAARAAKAAEFIEASPGGYASMIGERGVRLSGGQRQRIAIARELLKRPDILVLDEATSALDSESERAIQQSIEALSGQLTILIIAHRLSTIRNCDHVCVLHDGRIVEEGAYDELAARAGSRFQRLVQLQDLAAP
ncbi:MAG TPA: ABC transporter ATP-binding protein [Kofleriaceae bacterium]|jgi:subfamily B ATP-binding cassette protein MsbA|nr:ABC transporter ATP-binding protein [Kofleriaceae bacterium]